MAIDARIESVLEVNRETVTRQTGIRQAGNHESANRESTNRQAQPVAQLSPTTPVAATAPIPSAGLTIAEAARRTGVSVHTLRYYERAGLVVTPVDRTATNRRRYHSVDLAWIKVCTSLRATGMPIRTIRRYAELVCAGSGNEAERLELMEAHRAEVTAKLAEIQENLRLIDRKIDTYRSRLATGDATTLWAPHR